MRIIFDCYLRPTQGYGYAAIQIGLELVKKGIELIIPASEKHHLDAAPQVLLEKLVDLNTTEIEDAVTIVFRTPNPLASEVIRRRPFFWFTMWETTKLPDEWSAVLNEADGVFVPSNRQLKTFLHGEIKSKLSVVPLGVNVADYRGQRQPRAERSIYRFGFFATYLDHRKGVDVLLSAFEKEFPTENYPNVELWYKGQPPFNWPVDHHEITEPRVKFFNGLTTLDGNVSFLNDIDCFVFPSRGEGFGLPPLEAMSTGLPVIATRWDGPEDYLKHESSYPLNYHLGEVNLPSRNRNYVYQGYWAEPDLEHLRFLMRHCYEHRVEAYTKGCLAMDYVRENWTWERSAQALLDSIQ